MIARAAEVIRSASKPLIVAGGGVIYSGATDALAAFASGPASRWSETQAGKGSLPYDHPQSVGAVGSTGTTAANALATEADVVIGIGTRYSDFTTASRTAFNNPDVRFVNINVASFDSVKQGGCQRGRRRARGDRGAVPTLLSDYSVSDEYRTRTAELAQEWDDTVTAAYRVEDDGSALNQNQVIGLTNTLSDPRDVVVCAAGSMPGDLHKLWRTRDRKGYHVEYGYSCMGYEVAGGIGVRMAESRPRRVRHGRRRLLPDDGHRAGDRGPGGRQGHRGAGAEPRLRLDRLAVGVVGVTAIRHLLPLPQRRRAGSTGDKLPVDLAANAASLGADVIRVATAAEFTDAVKVAKANEHTTVIHVETDPLISAPDSESWWDVPVSQTSDAGVHPGRVRDVRGVEEDSAPPAEPVKPYDAKD